MMTTSRPDSSSGKFFAFEINGFLKGRSTRLIARFGARLREPRSRHGHDKPSSKVPMTPSTSHLSGPPCAGSKRHVNDPKRNVPGNKAHSTFFGLRLSRGEPRSSKLRSVGAKQTNLSRRAPELLHLDYWKTCFCSSARDNSLRGASQPQPSCSAPSC